MNRLPFTITFILCSLVLFYSGCQRITAVKDLFSKKPEVAAVSEVLKTAIPLSYAASLAMNAVSGDTAEQVQFIQGISGFPGNALIAITISSTHMLPVGSDTSGTIYVAGYWSSQEQAIISVFFTDLDITLGSLTLTNVATLPVQRDTNTIRVVYADQDVNSSDTAMTVTLTNAEIQAEWTKLAMVSPVDSAVSLEQNGWIINIDTRGTPGNPDDDIYDLAGAGQYAGASVSNVSVVQLVMLGVAMTPTNRLNPYEGRAILRDIDVSTGTTGTLPELGTSVLTFHSTKDGKVDVTIATGVYIGSTGSSLPLNLDK